jgi:hypothetical protein
VANLKDRNRAGLWAIVAANFVLFAIMARPVEILSGDLAELGRAWLPLLPAGLGLAAVGVVNGQADAITKARLVYWRVKDPLPGREAFTVIGPGDERVDMSALATKYGPLPTEPKAQNTLWYRIYKSVESDHGVEHAHREFLFARDYCFLSALMLAGLGGLSVLTFIGAGKALLYLAILIMQFVVTGQAARNHGRRLISTVLAVAGAKEA